MNEETETLEALETEHELKTETIAPRRLRKLILVSAVFLFFCLSFFGLVLLYVSFENQAPENFPTDTAIVIQPGTGVKEIAEKLADENVVRSAQVLYYTILLFHDPTTIKASTYVFDEPLTTYQVAKRLSEGDFSGDLVRLTHIEGERNSKLAERAATVLPEFDSARFMTAAVEHEGKLFPETYLIPPSFTDEELLELLLTTYEDTIEPLRPLIEKSGLTEEELITLASIVEREANSSTSKKMVAGIFFNRLDIGMALQADATIEYVLDTPIAELRAGELADHLEEIDSPYNTYLYPGLPPSPIGNPGLDSIMAVLEPEKSDYFYYITGDDGEFYYAETYNQHLDNIERYLR